MKKLAESDWDLVADEIGLRVVFATEKHVCLMEEGSADQQVDIFPGVYVLVVCQVRPELKHVGEIEFVDTDSLKDIIARMKERMKENGIRTEKSRKDSDM